MGIGNEVTIIASCTLLHFIAKTIDGLFKKILLTYGDQWDEYIHHSLIDHRDNILDIQDRRDWEQRRSKWTPDWETFQPLPFPRYMFRSDVVLPEYDPTEIIERSFDFM